MVTPGQQKDAMQLRSFGKTNWKPSALGFGCMRLPTLDGQHASPNINEAEAITMIRHAIDGGVNYIDTAYPYHGGQSELVVGKALQDGYREKVKVATKLPVWLVQGPADFNRLLDEQLRKLQTDHIDFYLLHSLNQNRWTDFVLKYDLLTKAAEALRDGRIGHLGFSVHDSYASFEEIVNGYDWSFCQIQYNYMDINNQAGTKGLKLAASRGLAVVVMEPLLGGRLVAPPPDVRGIMDEYPVRRSPAEWALRWLWDQPEVSLVLSGMTTMAQVEENLRVAEDSTIHAFTAAEQEVIKRARDKYSARTAVPCTKCNYCMPCPNGVDIPGVFDFFNYAHLFEDLSGARFKYKVFLAEPQRADHCIQCNTCEEKCPQNISVGEWMPKVSSLLS